MVGHQTIKSFQNRLSDGDTILVAEGYLFELERRGYLKAGPYIPEILLEKPELVKQLHEEFVHAGSDVVVALQYYSHRARLNTVGMSHEVEPLNMKALEIARQVANETGTLMAGNLCNTTIYDRKDANSFEKARDIFKESVQFAVRGGADFILGETFTELGEAQLAMEAIKQYGEGLPAVITFGQSNLKTTRDGKSYAEACKILELSGASVVGLNCSAGPEIILTQMPEIREACNGPIACLPVPYRTTMKQPLMHTLTIDGKLAFPDNLDRFSSTSDEISKFGAQAKSLGVQYLGLCCGNSSRYFRRLAQSVGRKPPASRFFVSHGWVWGQMPNFRPSEPGHDYADSSAPTM